MKIQKQGGLYAVLRFDPTSVGGPRSGRLGALLSRAAEGRFFSLTGSGEELSLVCEEGLAEEFQAREGGWRLFKVVGPLDFGLTGILSSIAAPLAVAGISIFAVSTYDTDYVLVKDGAYKAAAECLSAAGFEIVQ